MKVVQIAGFLGSGKTTAIIEIGRELSTTYGKRVGIIKNELGDIGVDQKFLSVYGLKAKEITSCCICAEMAAPFVKIIMDLREILDPEILIVEPSGVAKPHLISEIMEQASIGVSDLNMEQGPTITLVDAARPQIIDLKGFKPVVGEQLMDANVIAINKIDLTKSEEELSKLEDKIRKINPKAIIVRISALENKGLDKLIELILNRRG